MEPIIPMPIIGKPQLRAFQQHLYNNISPSEGYSEPITRVLRSFIPGQARESVEEEMDLYYGPRRFIHHPQINDELFATYLGIPQNKRRIYPTKFHIKESNYKPVGRDGKYYALPLDKITARDHRSGKYVDGEYIHETPWEQVIRMTRDLPLGRWDESSVLGDYGMNVHSIARNYDDRGEYVAYKDRYDLNPYAGTNAIVDNDIPILSDLGDISFGIGTPVDIYDRLYLDDYYGVSKTKSTYLPEVIIKPRNK